MSEPAMQPTKSRSRAPWLLAGCGCLSMILGVVLLGAYGFVHFRDAIMTAIGSVEMRTYTNTAEGRTGKLAEHYTPFSFDYPPNWDVWTGDDASYVSVERSVEGEVWERLNVADLSLTGDPDQDEALFPQLIQEIGALYSQRFENVSQVSEGPTQIAGYQGYEGIFQGSQDTQVPGQQAEVFLRAILLPQPGQNRGVTLLMFGSGVSPDLNSAFDLGVSGELPIILQTFRFEDQ